MERKKIQESDGEQKAWMEEAKAMTADKLPAFIDKLINGYEHDYGTICHAIAAAAIGAAWSVERTPQGGITGFQAGAIFWEFTKAWGVFGEGPMRMLEYKNMLYPQYLKTFRAISTDTWEWLQKKAKENLAGNTKSVSPNVLAHWETVAAGEVPFGYRVEND